MDLKHYKFYVDTSITKTKKKPTMEFQFLKKKYIKKS